MTGLWIDLPEHADIIEPINIPKLEDEEAAAKQALRNPIGTPSLKEMVKSSDRVSIVISDITRPTPSHKMIPWLLDELAHVPKENIVIINGTGSHRANTRYELVQMLGERVMDTVRVINHDAFDESALTYLGQSSTGSEVFLNKEYCESDFRIVTGFIEPHFFAGFSGGPKGIMPGVAGIKTILNFHNSKMIGHPESTWAVLDGNPIQQEATEIALKCKPEFMFNVTLNNDKEITRFFAGDVIAAHREGCKYVKEHAMAACEFPYDIVITTNSGYPLDQNLYQAGKGLSAAQQIVRKNGAIICAVECSDGLPAHGNYAKIMQMRKTPQELMEMIEDTSFSMFDQWAAQKQALVQLWADVYVFSSLHPDDVRKVMLEPIESIEAVVEALQKNLGTDSRIAVLPYGPLTIPYIKKGI